MASSKKVKNISLVEIFEETQEFINNSDYLKESIKNSIDHISVSSGEPDEMSIEDMEYCFELPCTRIKKKDKNIKVNISKGRTLDIAYKYAKTGNKKVAVLNFASAKHPGGQVENGSNAQEESLCRVSTLYNVLSGSDKARKEYYDFNVRNLNEYPLYSDKIIYSPDIVVFRPDVAYPNSFLPEDKWYKVDVITSPAPNLLRRLDKELITKEALYKTYVHRIEMMFTHAYLNGARILVLGAWGCGVFKNPPKLVAEAFADVCGRLGYAFDCIEFAIIDDNRGINNYKIFADTIVEKAFDESSEWWNTFVVNCE